MTEVVGAPRMLCGCVPANFHQALDENPDLYDQNQVRICLLKLTVLKNIRINTGIVVNVLSDLLLA